MVEQFVVDGWLSDPIVEEWLSKDKITLKQDALFVLKLYNCLQLVDQL